MISEKMRQSLYQELEREYPNRRVELYTGHGERGGGGEQPDLSGVWHQELLNLEEQLVTQLLFQLHTLFEFPVEDALVQSSVRETLRDTYGREEACRKNGNYDARTFALFLFRKYWHMAGAGPTAPPPSILTGLHHVEQAGFFQKYPQEIAEWTRVFLLIERYHRLNALERESRLDRYRSLRAHPGKPVLHGLEDLLVWTEQALLHAQERDIGALCRELAVELEGAVPRDLFPGMRLQPVLYVILKCHRFCLSETLEQIDIKRIDQLFANRELDSLLDLMRVVVQKTLDDYRLPDVGTILDQLQAEGFNIEHSGFRDPYVVHLIPLDDVERFERARLPIFLSLEKLSGELQEDMGLSREMLFDWHRRILNEITGDCEAYVLALAQPLPRANLIEKLVRFAASWVIAWRPWPLSGVSRGLEEDVRKLLPENAIRHLVRPRKGYEVKSKPELIRLVEAEGRRQWEALKRIASNYRIQGYHDYTQFARYVVFQHLQEVLGRSPGKELHRAGSVLRDAFQPEWVTEASRRFGIDPKQAHPHVLETVREYILEKTPRECIAGEIRKGFESSDNDINRIYNGVVDAITPTFYRLVVAYGRHQSQLPRLAASVDRIPQLVCILASPLDVLLQTAYVRSEQVLARSGSSLYRRGIRPYLLDAREWKAYLAWEAKRHVGEDRYRFLEVGKLDTLRAALENSAGSVDLPPHTLFCETVRSTLLGLLKPADGTEAVSDVKIKQLLALLPQLDCGACNRASCGDFARSLILGRSEPRDCLQLPGGGIPLLAGELGKLRGAGSEAGNGAAANMLDLLQDRSLWRHSPEREVEVFRNVLSAQVQKARRLFLERLRTVWEKLSHKPRIFKCPDLDVLYRELCRHMGYEATERLREEEKRLLVEHGEHRQEAEWRVLKQSQDWLTLSNHSRQGRSMLQQHDPAWVAQEAYREVFFLHQLNPWDRGLVLRHRLDRHQDGFSYWWNEDLLTMNLPDFSIRDWEDFSKIIKNAYWHQESSLAAGDALAMLQNELFLEEDPDRLLDTLLVRCVEGEEKRMNRNRARMQNLKDGHPIASVADLRELISILADEELLLHPTAGSSVHSLLSREERQMMDRERLWDRLQEENFVFAPDFSCRWEDLLPEEADGLSREPAPLGLGGQAGPGGKTTVWFLSGRDEPLWKRVALVRALIASCIRQKALESAEFKWLVRVHEDGFRERPPLASFKIFIRQRLKEGAGREQVEGELRNLLSSHPDVRKGILEDGLLGRILERHDELSRESGGPALPAHALSAEEDAAIEIPQKWRTFLDQLLIRHQSMDRERLLHYLFLLAKMEGNLDALTALLREIRETSDVIEAAWLRFTEERILEGPAAKVLPGTTLGIPLLASRLDDKGPVNRCLRDGLGRGEKKKIAMAVNEFLTFIRYHVLVQEERRGHPEDAFRDFVNAGYDLSGVEEEAIRAAVQREWEGRERLADRKIWIYTTVTARRLAAQHAELQESEKEFYKVRMDILKDDREKETLHEEIASRRGVALGQIKEEMYRQLSDLLESERIATFQNQIRQIVGQLDQKRREIYEGWRRGEINRRTLFYLLRQYQKRHGEPTWDDFEMFLRDHWFEPLAELRASGRPDREERIRDLDERFRSVLGISLLSLEVEAANAAREDLKWWMGAQKERLAGLQSSGVVRGMKLQEKR